jgi:hypothetical protein
LDASGFHPQTLAKQKAQQRAGDNEFGPRPGMTEPRGPVALFLR